MNRKSRRQTRRRTFGYWAWRNSPPVRNEVVARRKHRVLLRAYLEQVARDLSAAFERGLVAAIAAHAPIQDALEQLAALPVEHRDRDVDELLADPTVFDPRHCHVCGCTDLDCTGCIERTGQPCHWITDTLCSACAEDD